MITESELRERIKPNPDDDHLLSLLKSQVIELWEQETGGLWNARTDYVEYYETETRMIRTLYLALRPVASITKVETADGPDDEYTETTDYALDEHRLRRGDGSYWPRKVRITYTGGYSDSDCPADIKYALGLQAHFEAQRHTASNIMIRGKSIEGTSAQFYENAYMHPVFKNLVHRRRRQT